MAIRFRHAGAERVRVRSATDRAPAFARQAIGSPDVTAHGKVELLSGPSHKAGTNHTNTTTQLQQLQTPTQLVAPEKDVCARQHVALTLDAVLVERRGQVLGGRADDAPERKKGKPPKYPGRALWPLSSVRRGGLVCPEHRMEPRPASARTVFRLGGGLRNLDAAPLRGGCETQFGFGLEKLTRGR